MSFEKAKKYNSLDEVKRYLQEIDENAIIKEIEVKPNIFTKTLNHKSVLSVKLTLDDMLFRGNVVELTEKNKTVYALDINANLNIELNKYNVELMQIDGLYKLGIKKSDEKALLDFNKISLEDYLRKFYFKEYNFNFEHGKQPEGKYGVDFQNKKASYHTLDISSVINYEDKHYIGMEFKSTLDLRTIKIVAPKPYNNFFIKTNDNDYYMITKYDSNYTDQEDLLKLATDKEYKGVFYECISLTGKQNKMITEEKMNEYFSVDILFSIR